ncbi:MAG: hypothetical protein ACM3TR_10945 [Caulobacteraceae bacterium]
MAKRQPIKVIVHKPSDEEVSKLVARAFAQIIDDRIQALPEEMRVPTYDAIIESLKKLV